LIRLSCTGERGTVAYTGRSITFSTICMRTYSPHTLNRRFQMFQQFLVQNKNDIVFDDYTTSFTNGTSILYYNCTITDSTFYTPRTTTYETLFLVFPSSFFFTGDT
jgi:hypothetical protein